MAAHGFKSRAIAVARQRCPRCLEGRVFRGALAMNDACPSCGLVFEREPGYFVGAMYVSYAMAIPAYLVAVLLLRVVFRRLPDLAVLAAGVPIICLASPYLFRSSRLIWMHFDRTLDPEGR
ncbi:MAG TPA: DUF983 domain-containing protein [Candidatus Binatia bacterium]|nr:DUF983 domain-containing protein [Candidatus Binatia bacterium]